MGEVPDAYYRIDLHRVNTVEKDALPPSQVSATTLLLQV